MKTIGKALIGTVAAGAMAMSSATPAFARHNDGGIDAGEVIAGALVIGGIAAVAAAASKNNDRNYGYGDRDYSYDRAGYRENVGYRDHDRDGYRGGDRGFGGMNPRRAVEQCVWAAEREAGRSRYGRADVTDIRSVRETRYGYEVRGRIAVKAHGRGWRSGDANYGRGWDNDYRGWNSGMRGYDSGRFECRVERGRVVDVDLRGI